jgi:Yip1 domain
MGHRTLSLNLVLQALFLDGDAYDQLRDDDNPFIEGLFLIVIISAGVALLSFLGQILAWISMPSMEAIKEVILRTLQQMPWWASMTGSAQAYDGFLRSWDMAWRIFPTLFGAPDPLRGAANILIMPLTAVLGWLLYGLLAHAFARLFKGVGTLNQTLGTTALSYTPWLFYGLGIIPFFVAGGALGTWQLICRYKALRSSHHLSWGSAFWATLLPYLVYGLLLVLAGGIAAVVMVLVIGRQR